MPQIFHVLRCFSCKTFQVHQVKKANKWQCKLCHEKQSIQKVFGEGSGADCRKHVQCLNMNQGLKQESLNVDVESPSLSPDNMEPDDVRLFDTGQNHHQEEIITIGSKWSMYVDDDETQALEDEDCSLDEVNCTTDRKLFLKSMKQSKPGYRYKPYNSSSRRKTTSSRKSQWEENKNNSHQWEEDKLNNSTSRSHTSFNNGDSFSWCGAKFNTNGHNSEVQSKNGDSDLSFKSKSENADINDKFDSEKASNGRFHSAKTFEESEDDRSNEKLINSGNFASIKTEIPIYSGVSVEDEMFDLIKSESKKAPVDKSKSNAVKRTNFDKNGEENVNNGNMLNRFDNFQKNGRSSVSSLQENGGKNSTSNTGQNGTSSTSKWGKFLEASVSDSEENESENEALMADGLFTSAYVGEVPSFKIENHEDDLFS